jgi:peptidoglycan/xylan/chitin deacetylase (PgdA/CDA1 family)
MLGKLAERGAELGMHAHPQSMFDHRYTRYLGEYDAEMQREILGLTTEAVAKAVGKRPTSFRPGNFSASDVTYDVLYQLGFRQGSVSDPGRNAPNFAAVWKGAYLDPHYVDPTNKLGVGKLPFLEVPLTTDPEQLQPNGFPYELRIESGPFDDWHKPIIEKTLKRWEREHTPFRALCIFSHNTYAYDDLSESRTATLQQMLDYLGKLSSVKLAPVTLQEMHNRFKKRAKQS